MAIEKNKNKEAVWKDASGWNCRVRVLVNDEIYFRAYNALPDQETAKVLFQSCQSKFEKQMKELKKATGIAFTLRSYLLYWMTEIFFLYAKRSTRAVGSWVINNLIIPVIDKNKDRPLTKVTSEYLEEVVTDCSDASDYSGYMAYRYLKLALDDACRDNLIPRDPILSVKKPTVSIKPVVRLREEEIIKLIQGAKKYKGIPLIIPVVLALFLGLRTGEIRALKMSDFEKCSDGTAILTISRQVVRNFDIVGSKVKSGKHVEILVKGGHPRKIKIPKIIMDIIEEKGDPGDCLCPGKDGWMADNTMRGALKRVCIRESIPVVTMHDLRHLSVGLMLEKGLPLEMVAKVLGHRNPVLTFNIYASIIDGDSESGEKIASAVDPLYGGIS